MSAVSPPRETTPESVVARLRPHSRALFWPTVALMIVAGGSTYALRFLPAAWMRFTLLGVALLLCVFLFLVPVVRWLARNYTITTRRIVIRTGLLVRTRQELLHSRGYDVTVRSAGLQGLFRSGDVLINTGLEHPVVLRDVPRASLVQSALHDLMESSSNLIAARRQENQVRHPAEPPPDETTAWGRR